MRTDALYLADIIEAADDIAAFVGGMGRESFLGNNLVRSAVLQKLTVIGEAAARLSPELRNRHPETEWADIVAFRNIAVHAYFTVDWSIVWVAATQDAPVLRQRAAGILASEFPDARQGSKGRGD